MFLQITCAAAAVDTSDQHVRFVDVLLTETLVVAVERLWCYWSQLLITGAGRSSDISRYRSLLLNVSLPPQTMWLTNSRLLFLQYVCLFWLWCVFAVGAVSNQRGASLGLFLFAVCLLMSLSPEVQLQWSLSHVPTVRVGAGRAGVHPVLHV